MAVAWGFHAFATVDLYERQRYDDKRLNCGEAINEGGLIPLPKIPSGGPSGRV